VVKLFTKQFDKIILLDRLLLSNYNNNHAPLIFGALVFVEVEIIKCGPANNLQNINRKLPVMTQ
jgi:hypothetical protein